MKFAFVIFKYFPYGGVQRDMLRIALDCVALGHHVTIYTGAWQGAYPVGLSAENLQSTKLAIEIITSQGFLNHQKHKNLIQRVQALIAQKNFDLVVGFNRMAGLDVYFAADSCYVAKIHEERACWYRYTPRYLWFSDMEQSIFSVYQHTHILTLTPKEQAVFQRWYATQDVRFHLIPPYLSSTRFSSALKLTNRKRHLIRQQVRAQFGFKVEHKLLLLVGSGFKTKGADRVVLAIHALPAALKAQLKCLIIGQDASKHLKQQIADLNLSAHIQVLEGRDDIPILMQASDVLVHPARRELAGHVLLEAMACGLPVLSTDQCGYAPHIIQAQAGVVLSSPFEQYAFNQALLQLLTHDTQAYQAAGQAYAKQLMQANSGQAEAYILTSIADNIAKKPRYQKENLQAYSTDTVQTDVLWIAPQHQTVLAKLQFEDYMALTGYTVRAAANRKTMRITLSGRSYFIKQHQAIGWKELIKSTFSFKRPIIGAMTEVTAIQTLSNIGIATTPIAAYGIQGLNASAQRSFLLTEDLGAIVSLEDIVKTWQQHPPTEGERATMLGAVAKLARRFHAAGLCHRDFYLCHIALASTQVVDEYTEFYLLDLHRVLHQQSPHGRQVCKDIAGLIFSCLDYGFTEQDWTVFKAHYLPQASWFWRYAFARAHRLHRKFHSAKHQARFKAQKAATDLD